MPKLIPTRRHHVHDFFQEDNRPNKSTGTVRRTETWDEGQKTVVWEELMNISDSGEERWEAIKDLEVFEELENLFHEWLFQGDL